ncbi:DUF2635 domain-containing protein [Paraburkholderia sp.]|uniref:DUF2635 domain-containing protein n=1 Tax=Paraburkholderia sp. TaxID=1926495 RepID=UPI002D470C52|nr:DUF2635 domain-containing protein [Paraburkholderia sp.]HZZ04639.1 DUF2635 domain-containing protein [Paraburkholderia sp.]
MKVIARTGLRVPKERAARKYITDAEAVDVPDTAYYIRRVTDGDLIDQSTASDAATAPSAADTGAVSTGDKKTTKGA